MGPDSLITGVPKSIVVAEEAKPKVLFIDDDPLMHRLYQPHIERAGFSVINLLEGAEAVEVASRDQPRVIIMDMLLPGTDGLAAILLLKATSTTRDIPIIAISADQGYHAQRHQLESLGVNVFLSKPFGATKLVSEICRLGQAHP